MSETITLEISREDLTKAIAQVLVERSQGAARLQALENQQVSRHIRSLLADLNLKDRVWSLVDDALRMAVREMAAPSIANVQTTINSFFHPLGPTKVSRAELTVANEVSLRVRHMLLNKKETLEKMLEDISARLVVGPPKDGK
jgi:hypothetical protein